LADRQAGTISATARLAGAAAVALGLCIAPAATAVWASEPAPAKSTRAIALELNRLDDAGQGCRMSFVMRNATGVAIEALIIELVLFDGEGRVASVISIDPGLLPVGKTRVKQFDVAGLACRGVGRLLVNDVPVCKGEGLEPAACLAALEPTSRTGVPLVD
jgi:hypothetical protein